MKLGVSWKMLVCLADVGLELSPNSSKIPDAAMTTAETMPWEWPVAPESRLRSSPGVKLAT